MAVFDLGLDGVYEVALYYEGSSWQNYTTGLLSYSDGRLISDMSYSDIAEYFNFSSQSYFTSCFRKATGQTPHQYRQSHYQTATTATKHFDL